MLTPSDGAGADSGDSRTLVVRMHRRPGALDRVVGLLRRHGCTLVALGFGPSSQPEMDDARLTISGAGASRVAQQLTRLVDVVSTRDLTWPRASSAVTDDLLSPHFQADGMSDAHHQET